MKQPPRRRQRNRSDGGGDGSATVESVKRFCRFRGQNFREVAGGGQSTVSVDSDGQHATLRDPVGGSQVEVGTGARVAFDGVFGPSATQQEVFAAAGGHLVDDVFAGYNCAVVAFGQTGSGKTHTMLGDMSLQATAPVTSTMPSRDFASATEAGLVPRAVAQLYERMAAHATRGAGTHEYALYASYVELYSGVFTDLLREVVAMVGERSGGGGESARKARRSKAPKLQIRKDKARGVFLDGATEVRSASAAALTSLLRMAEMNRRVSATLMNERSSRSHAILTLRLARTDVQTRATRVSKCVLVDLAGSENIRKTQAVGGTLREASDINLSLTALGRVIAALNARDRPHVPYRDSPLTRLLSDVIGGNCRTSLMLTCSSSSLSYSETMHTVRFGQSARWRGRTTESSAVALPSASSPRGGRNDSAILPSPRDGVAQQQQRGAEWAHTLSAAEMSRIADIEERRRAAARVGGAAADRGTKASGRTRSPSASPRSPSASPRPSTARHIAGGVGYTMSDINGVVYPIRGAPAAAPQPKQRQSQPPLPLQPQPSRGELQQQLAACEASALSCAHELRSAESTAAGELRLSAVIAQAAVLAAKLNEEGRMAALCRTLVVLGVEPTSLMAYVAPLSAKHEQAAAEQAVLTAEEQRMQSLRKLAASTLSSAREQESVLMQRIDELEAKLGEVRSAQRSVASRRASADERLAEAQRHHAELRARLGEVEGQVGSAIDAMNERRAKNTRANSELLELAHANRELEEAARQELPKLHRSYAQLRRAQSTLLSK